MLAILGFFDFWMIVLAVLIGSAGSGAAAWLGRRDAARLLRLEKKIDLILQKADIVYRPATELPEDVIEALRKGEDNEAAELYQKARGVSPEAAKILVEKAKKEGDY